MGCLTNHVTHQKIDNTTHSVVKAVIASQNGSVIEEFFQQCCDRVNKFFTGLTQFGIHREKTCKAKDIKHGHYILLFGLNSILKLAKIENRKSGCILRRGFEMFLSQI